MENGTVEEELSYLEVQNLKGEIDEQELKTIHKTVIGKFFDYLKENPNLMIYGTTPLFRSMCANQINVHTLRKYYAGYYLPFSKRKYGLYEVDHDNLVYVKPHVCLNREGSFQTWLSNETYKNIYNACVNENKICFHILKRTILSENSCVVISHLIPMIEIFKMIDEMKRNNKIVFRKQGRAIIPFHISKEQSKKFDKMAVILK